MITKNYKYIYNRSDENQGSIVEKEVSEVNDKDSLKQYNLNYRQISKLEIMMENLEKRVKALERGDNDYPNKEELKKLRREGND